MLAHRAVAPGTPGSTPSSRASAATCSAARRARSRALGPLVFGETRARRDLEAIVHPAVYRRSPVARRHRRRRATAAGHRRHSAALRNRPRQRLRSRHRRAVPAGAAAGAPQARDGLTEPEARAANRRRRCRSPRRCGAPTTSSTRRDAERTDASDVGSESPNADRCDEVQSDLRPHRSSRSSAASSRRLPAALSVFFSSIAIVSGPTPPGHGSARRPPQRLRDARRPTTVEPFAVELREPRTVGPERLDDACSRSVTRLMPTSTTVAPGLTKSGVTNPAGRWRRPGCRRARDTAARSGVFEWQIVTVASRCSSSSAIGLPTMSLRPMTTACLPAIGDLLALEQLDDAGRRARHERRPVLHEPADVGGMKAVHVLGGIDRVEHLLRGVLPIAAGSGDCTRMPSHAASPLSRATRPARRRARSTPAAGAP